jgi:hypothetical protein
MSRIERLIADCRRLLEAAAECAAGGTFDGARRAARARTALRRLDAVEAAEAHEAIVRLEAEELCDG